MNVCFLHRKQSQQKLQTFVDNATHGIVRSITSVGGQCPAGAAQSYVVSTPMRVEFVALVLLLTGVSAVATNRNNNCKFFFPSADNR